jgi:hypothetical protein
MLLILLKVGFQVLDVLVLVVHCALKSTHRKHELLHLQTELL